MQRAALGRVARAAALSLVVAAAGACRPPAAAAPVARGESVDVPRAARMDLAALAAEMTPPKVVPLARDIPPSIREQIDLGLVGYTDDRSRLTAAKERITKLEGVRTWNVDVIVHGLPDGTRPFVTMLEALVLLEPLALGDGPLAEEARADAFPMYFLAGLVGRIGASSIAFARGAEVWLREQGQNPTVRPGFLDDFVAVLQFRGEALHRAVGARILRAGRPAGAVTKVLHFLASAKELDELFEAELPLREEAVRAAGANADEADWANLATAYARAIDVPRARVALARARSRSTGDPRQAPSKSVTTATTDVALAETMARLENATTFDERLARAQAAFDLHLTVRARSEFEALRTQWPADARARTGLARAMFGKGFALPDVTTLRAAWNELDTPGLAHTDGDYYELAVGLSGLRTMSELATTGGDERRVYAGIATSFARLAELAKGLAPHNPARAAALQYLAEVVREAITASETGGADGAKSRLRRCLAEAHALRARFPESVDVAKVAVAAAGVADDGAAAFAEVEAPLPAAAADDPDFVLDRAVAEVGLVARFGGADRLARARALLDETARGNVNRAELALVEGDLDALGALLAPRDGAWQGALDAYDRALTSIDGAHRARALNNSGFAMLQLGDADGARRRWASAAAADKEGRVAACSAALQLATTVAGRDAAREGLTALAHDDGRPCNYAARAGLVVLAKAAHAPRAKLTELAADAVRSADAGPAGPVLAPHAASSHLLGKNTFQLAFGFAPTSGSRRLRFPLALAVRPEPWLVVRPAIDEAEVRRLAGKR